MLGPHQVPSLKGVYTLARWGTETRVSWPHTLQGIGKYSKVRTNNPTSLHLQCSWAYRVSNVLLGCFGTYSTWFQLVRCANSILPHKTKTDLALITISCGHLNLVGNPLKQFKCMKSQLSLLYEAIVHLSMHYFIVQGQRPVGIVEMEGGIFDEKPHLWKLEMLPWGGTKHDIRSF